MDKLFQQIGNQFFHELTKDQRHYEFVKPVIHELRIPLGIILICVLLLTIGILFLIYQMFQLQKKIG